MVLKAAFPYAEIYEKIIQRSVAKKSGLVDC
jgi:hypothetical protein